jgi:tRNA G18 (ribose-2'-O)-methylase SpoU
MRKLKLEELNRVSLDDFKQLKKQNIVVVLDDIRSALNVGSIFRSSDAFNIERILLTGLTACPPHKEITKTAIGATESVKWEYNQSILETMKKLKEENYSLIAIEQTTKSIPINQFKKEENKKYALVFGNEVEGINDGILPLIDQAIEIPQYGTKHSLNVAVCAGIILYAMTT